MQQMSTQEGNGQKRKLDESMAIGGAQRHEGLSEQELRRMTVPALKELLRSRGLPACSLLLSFFLSYL